MDVFYSRDVEGIIIGIKLESVSYKAHLFDHTNIIKLRIDNRDAKISECMMFTMGRYLVCFLEESHRQNVTAQTQIIIYADNFGHFSVNVFAIFDASFYEKYQLPFILHEAEGEDGINWFDANTECHEKYGTTLLSIHDKEESFLVDGFIGANAAWIGFHDFDINAIKGRHKNYGNYFDWRWIDGSIVDWTDWNEQRPDNDLKGEDCEYAQGQKYIFDNMGYSVKPVFNDGIDHNPPSNNKEPITYFQDGIDRHDDDDRRRLSYAMSGWRHANCEQKKKFYLCSSPYWYPDSKRKFEINVEDYLDELSIVSIGNTNPDVAVCIDSVSIWNNQYIDGRKYNDEEVVALEMVNNWIGGGIKNPSSLRAIFQYPVCKTQVKKMEILYQSANTTFKEGYTKVPGNTCTNENKENDGFLCQPSETFDMAAYTRFELPVQGMSTWGFQWASSSAVTLDIEESTWKTTNELEFLKLFVIKNVDIDAETLVRTLNKIRQLEIRPSHIYADTNAVINKYGQHVDALWERDFVRIELCADEFPVPPAHKVNYDFLFNGISLTVDVLVDLKLTLCKEFVNEDDEDDDKKYVYLNRVPAQIDHFEPLTCNTRFLPSEYVPNTVKCNVHQKLAVVQKRDWLPICDSDNYELYDGCQYDANNNNVWCVDVEGNPKDGKAINLPPNMVYQQVCVELLKCEDTKVVWPPVKTPTPTVNVTESDSSKTTTTTPVPSSNL